MVYVISADSLNHWEYFRTSISTCFISDRSTHSLNVIFMIYDSVLIVLIRWR